jgi:hypothetical protein
MTVLLASVMKDIVGLVREPIGWQPIIIDRATL